ASAPRVRPAAPTPERPPGRRSPRSPHRSARRCSARRARAQGTYPRTLSPRLAPLPHLEAPYVPVAEGRVDREAELRGDPRARPLPTFSLELERPSQQLLRDSPSPHLGEGRDEGDLRVVAPVPGEGGADGRLAEAREVRLRVADRLDRREVARRGPPRGLPCSAGRPPRP